MSCLYGAGNCTQTVKGLVGGWAETEESFTIDEGDDKKKVTFRMNSRFLKLYPV